jgi:putative PIN family toxin of toxin-antitoxin system
MKFVLDTDVVVSGVRSPTGASAQVLRLARQCQIEIAVTVPLILEYESVLTRPEHLDASGLEASDMRTVVDVLVDVAAWTRIDYRWRPQTRDPADEMVLEAAINAGVDAIVTFNKRHFGKSAEKFGIACLWPYEALEKIR